MPPITPATPMKHPGRIGIGSWRRPVTFHSVTVREVSGPGKVMASAAVSQLGSPEGRKGTQLNGTAELA